MKKRPDPTALMAKATQKLFKKRPQYPNFTVGDTIRVFVKVIEGEKSRVQAFEGIVIGMKRGGTNASFVVRKISYGVGVERIFPFYSPVIDKITVVSKGEVRRAKLYYLRALSGRASRIRSEQVFGAEATGTMVENSSGDAGENQITAKAAQG